MTGLNSPVQSLKYFIGSHMKKGWPIQPLLIGRYLLGIHMLWLASLVLATPLGTYLTQHGDMSGLTSLD